MIIGATLREANGLAMSSRNRRLKENQLYQASAIYHCFQDIKKNVSKNNFKNIIEQAKTTLLNSGFDKIDYLNFANANSLEPIEKWDDKTPIVILVAALWLICGCFVAALWLPFSQRIGFNSWGEKI